MLLIIMWHTERQKQTHSWHCWARKYNIDIEVLEEVDPLYNNMCKYDPYKFNAATYLLKALLDVGIIHYSYKLLNIYKGWCWFCLSSRHYLAMATFSQLSESGMHHEGWMKSEWNSISLPVRGWTTAKWLGVNKWLGVKKNRCENCAQMFAPSDVFVVVEKTLLRVIRHSYKCPHYYISSSKLARGFLKWGKTPVDLVLTIIALITRPRWFHELKIVASFWIIEALERPTFTLFQKHLVIKPLGPEL